MGACGVMRAVCSTWGSIFDALLPRLRPRCSLAVMQGKLGWYQSVTEVDLLDCEGGVCGPLAELRSMPSLRTSCCQRAAQRVRWTLRRCVVSTRSPR